MSGTCPCQYRCGRLVTNLSKSSVIKNELFVISMTAQREEIDPKTNILRWVTFEEYVPAQPLTITAIGGGKPIGLAIPAYTWNSGKAVINGASFTVDPPDNAVRVSVSISMADRCAPSEGTCSGANPIELTRPYEPTLDKWCSEHPEVKGELAMTNNQDWLGGADLYYDTIAWGVYIGHIPYRQDMVFGPMPCPFGVCNDATWTITWDLESPA